MNNYTGTPVNTVWFNALGAILLGILAFAGPQAANAVFSLPVTASYFAYSVPIIARFVGKNEFKPGPFTLGRWVSGPLVWNMEKVTNSAGQGFPVALTAVSFMAFMGLVFLFPTRPRTTGPEMNY